MSKCTERITGKEYLVKVVDKLFYDTETLSWYKVKSILNKNEVQVVLFDFMKDVELDERINYNKSKKNQLKNKIIINLT